MSEAVQVIIEAVVADDQTRLKLISCLGGPSFNGLIITNLEFHVSHDCTSGENNEK